MPSPQENRAYCPTATTPGFGPRVSGDIGCGVYGVAAVWLHFPWWSCARSSVCGGRQICLKMERLPPRFRRWEKGQGFGLFWFWLLNGSKTRRMAKQETLAWQVVSLVAHETERHEPVTAAFLGSSPSKQKGLFVPERPGPPFQLFAEYGRTFVEVVPSNFQGYIRNRQIEVEITA
ncbi:hypothetical protein M408DRAFT_7521 [Serendipita vermifera MAFF 305830]|uniref:Uncharacterized protein n=1 Tax=Serendipita vermifera MAFF 305830 TaxID=933852 RepID=A0A0C2WW80_SERVB|nr:hypothetical protein M408DRAFT_7521 [Serendipita vermifera MAFF 305830]